MLWENCFNPSVRCVYLHKELMWGIQLDQDRSRGDETLELGKNQICLGGPGEWSAVEVGEAQKPLELFAGGGSRPFSYCLDLLRVCPACSQWCTPGIRTPLPSQTPCFHRASGEPCWHGRCVQTYLLRRWEYHQNKQKQNGWGNTSFIKVWKTAGVLLSPKGTVLPLRELKAELISGRYLFLIVMLLRPYLSCYKKKIKNAAPRGG